jgi:hypothetical protein
MVEPKILKEMEENMDKIKKHLKVAQDIQKIYVDKGRTTKEFKVGDRVFFKVKVERRSLKLGNYSKLVENYSGPFENL